MPNMAIVRKACLSISAITILAVAVTVKIGDHGREALCDGRRYEKSALPNGASPYIRLSADGISGQFLLDYGATRSSLSASAFAASDGSVRNAALSLPSFEGGNFDLRHFDMPLQPAGRQLGLIGTDFLSLLSVQFTGSAVFLGAQPCQPSALRSRGLIPIAQKGFFSSDRSMIDVGLPNVPVVFLRLGEVQTWAQIDTGYDDIVYTHSVDINEALYERLVTNGIRLERFADISVSTCEGRESRHVYTAEGRSLVIETDEAKPIVQTETFHLILKPANRCGGIGAMTIPAAQLGASFLQIFGTVVFDPRSGTVWLDGNAGELQSVASAAAP
jgi:hypothetical protein